MVRSAPTGAAEDTATPDILANIAAFARSLRAGKRSPSTIESYATGVAQFADFLARQGMPRNIGAIRQEHVEAFIEQLLSNYRPATAANRYRSLQQFFRWLVDEGEITASPMGRMHPPHLAEDGSRRRQGQPDRAPSRTARLHAPTRSAATPLVSTYHACHYRESRTEASAIQPGAAKRVAASSSVT